MARRTELVVVPLLVESNEPLHPMGNAIAFRRQLISFDIAWAGVTEFARPLKVARALYELLKADRRPSSIVRNLAIFPKALWVASLVRRMKIDHVHAHWASLPTSIAWIVGQLTSVPWSFTAHRYDIDEANALALKLGACSFARAISATGRDLMLRSLNVAVHVIHMGVNVPATSSSLSDFDTLRLIIPANLVAVKGHTYLLHGLAECKSRGFKFSCIIAGDGKMRDEIDRLRVALGLEGLVSMAGPISHENLLRMYGSSEIDVVILTSAPTTQGEQEGIPVALIEAMSFGIPVIATNCGAIAELVEGHGLLIPPADPNKIADAVGEFRSLERRRTLGLLGRARVVKDYNIETIAAQLHNLMKSSRPNEFRQETAHVPKVPPSAAAP